MQWLIALNLIVLVALVAVYAVYSFQRSTQAASRFDAQRAQTQAAIQHAKLQGFTDQDLKPFTDQQNQILAQGTSFWPDARAASYDRQSAQLSQLRGSLDGFLAKVVTQAKANVNQQVATGHTLLQENAQQGGDVGSIQARLDQIAHAVAGTTSIQGIRELGSQAQHVNQEAAAQAAFLKQENAYLQQGAAALLAQTQDVNALRTQAGAQLAQGRNDASLAAYESKAGRFKQIDTVMAANARMEFFTGKLASPDLNQVALAAAAEQRYGGQIHQLMQAGLGPKHIVVSFSGQHLWAYQNGNQVNEMPVTSGPRGDTAFGTDFGPMKVLHADHPWKMHSPWPQGSPYWYPDTVVQYATFFTVTGEAIHDASWQPDSTLGPGSQFSEGTRSHGCIHVPQALAGWFYTWANVGTPVDVLPYDGSPVANQLSQMTTDNNGKPMSAA
ncbi:MAG: L,D-transpeptidase family protein [Candidatus Dormibacteraeota bacterium]|nr:L,D-transpeptidase family protein [Candidatus Dormibacteraeota bacterium]MBO0759742.1 L,D-transpeptidase family protein [Candidatus Dormibacteraeota bacterium]